ncbi:hypothetical protein GCM10022295_93390 [Streptomyces osmaniensis]|uniref:Uncharacterized protein n=1 Tax=Streptomyces osmaniensis TaxID=593134 RepID=A0ABP6Z5W4_9ACTN
MPCCVPRASNTALQWFDGIALPRWQRGINYLPGWVSIYERGLPWD